MEILRRHLVVTLLIKKLKKDPSGRDSVERAERNKSPLPYVGSVKHKTNDTKSSGSPGHSSPVAKVSPISKYLVILISICYE